MIKKNTRSHNRVQLKNKYPAKPVNRGNQGYLAKLTNRVVNSKKFNNIIFLKLFFIKLNFLKNKYFSNTNLMLRYFFDTAITI